MAYVGQGIKNGTFSVLDTSGNTYNGSNVTFDLGTQVSSPAQLLVSHDGVIQKPVTDYVLATGGTQITFTTAPASGASIFITEISGAVGAPMNRDINGDELILDADADTSITADTDDQIDIRIAGNDDFKLTAKTLSIGGAAAADSKIVFDGNAQDFHIGIDDSADDLTIGLGTALGTTSHIVIDEAGCVTKPLQPAFLAVNDGSDSITNATETTIALDTEIFDVNGDVSSNTFTAPVTGKYFLSGHVRLDAGSSANDRFNRVYLRFNASNRSPQFEMGQVYTDEDDRMGVTGSIVLDMDASDTVVMRVFASRNGASGATTTSGHSTEPLTFFSGYLVA
jgi:hypothetical protein